jgi:hypothetical protein
VQPHLREFWIVFWLSSLDVSWQQPCIRRLVIATEIGTLHCVLLGVADLKYQIWFWIKQGSKHVYHSAWASSRYTKTRASVLRLRPTLDLFLEWRVNLKQKRSNNNSVIIKILQCHWLYFRKYNLKADLDPWSYAIWRLAKILNQSLTSLRLGSLNNFVFVCCCNKAQSWSTSSQGTSWVFKPVVSTSYGWLLHSLQL